MEILEIGLVVVDWAKIARSGREVPGCDHFPNYLGVLRVGRTAFSIKDEAEVSDVVHKELALFLT